MTETSLESESDGHGEFGTLLFLFFRFYFIRFE